MTQMRLYWELNLFIAGENQQPQDYSQKAGCTQKIELEKKHLGKSEKENLDCWGESVSGVIPMKWKIGISKGRGRVKEESSLYFSPTVRRQYKNKHGENNVPGGTCQLDIGKAESFGIEVCFARKKPDTSCRENALKILAWILPGPVSNQLLKGSWGPGCSKLLVLQGEGIFILFIFLQALKKQRIWKSWDGFRGPRGSEKL